MPYKKILSAAFYICCTSSHLHLVTDPVIVENPVGIYCTIGITELQVAKLCTCTYCMCASRHAFIHVFIKICIHLYQKVGHGSLWEGWDNNCKVDRTCLFVILT